MQRAWSTFQIKAINEDARTFDGIASTPATDRMEDQVDPMGAKFTLPIPLMWQHGYGFTPDPVGWVTWAKPNKNGIPVKGQFAKVDGPPSLREDLDRAWTLVKTKLVRGLSIGFNPIKYEAIEGSLGLRYLEWDWLELSPVAIAANADASITSIKSIDQAMRGARGHAGAVYLRAHRGAVYLR